MNKHDFPILNQEIVGKKLVYLDSSATSQKPNIVIQTLDRYYKSLNANIHRGVYKLSEVATEVYEKSREKVAKFINADANEIIFTKNATEALNLLAYSLKSTLKSGDEIVLSQMEHHSNIVPWQMIAKETGARIVYWKIDEEGKLAESPVNEKTKIISITHVSNVLGTINPIKDIAKGNAILIVDAAQSIPHMKIDVKQLDADFLVFSGHKMYGPTGIGVLYGKRALLENMQPFLYGGDMIKEVTFKEAKWNDLPHKFEAGTPAIAEVIGLGAAIDYLNSIGMEKIEAHERELVNYAYEKLSQVPRIKIYGPKERASLISFNLDGIHAHDVVQILDSEGIACRGGHQCAMPLHREVLGVQGSVRASFGLYNEKEDVDALINALEKVRKVFKR